MRRFQILSAASIFAARAVSAYDQYYFTSNATEWKCNDFSFGCEPPQVCAHDPVLDKSYCCGAGEGAVCWSGADDCFGTNGAPASSQVGCVDNSFCCLAEREECTQRTSQINICWATPENPFTETTPKRLNDTFSSISSERPQATSYTFNLQRVLSTSTPVSSSASATDSPSSTSATATSTNSSSPPPDDDSGISGGAIAGIVVGVIGGLALLGAAAFFLWRRKKNSDAHGTELDSNPYTQNGYGAVAQSPPQEKYAQHGAGQNTHYGGAAAYPPQEMSAQTGPVEVEGSGPHMRP